MFTSFLERNPRVVAVVVGGHHPVQEQADRPTSQARVSQHLRRILGEPLDESRTVLAISKLNIN